MNKIPLTPEITYLLKSYIQAKQLVDSIYPVVNSYKCAILKEINAVDQLTGEPIREDRYAFAMEKEKLNLYFRRCDEEAAVRNLEHTSGGCPLLDAENKERIAKRKLCEYLLPRIPGWENITFDKLTETAQDKQGNYKKDHLGRFIDDADEFINLSLQLLRFQVTGEILQLVQNILTSK